MLVYLLPFLDMRTLKVMTCVDRDLKYYADKILWRRVRLDFSATRRGDEALRVSRTMHAILPLRRKAVREFEVILAGNKLWDIVAIFNEVLGMLKDLRFLEKLSIRFSSDPASQLRDQDVEGVLSCIRRAGFSENMRQLMLHVPLSGILSFNALNAVWNSPLMRVTTLDIFSSRMSPDLLGRNFAPLAFPALVNLTVQNWEDLSMFGAAPLQRLIVRNAYGNDANYPQHVNAHLGRFAQTLVDLEVHQYAGNGVAGFAETVYRLPHLVRVVFDLQNVQEGSVGPVGFEPYECSLILNAVQSIKHLRELYFLNRNDTSADSWFTNQCMRGIPSLKVLGLDGWMLRRTYAPSLFMRQVAPNGAWRVLRVPYKHHHSTEQTFMPQSMVLEPPFPTFGRYPAY